MKIRITAVHPNDPCPAHKVGDVVTNPEELRPTLAHHGWSYLQPKSNDTHHATWCKYEVIPESGLLSNTVEADEIDEDPLPEEIEVDLRNMIFADLADVYLMLVVARVRDACKHAGVSVTCLVN